MFGLQGESKDKNEEFLFDLEQEAKDGSKARGIKESVVNKTKQVKTLLRSGLDKAEFDDLSILLQGYTALQRVITRIIKTN